MIIQAVERGARMLRRAVNRGPAGIILRSCVAISLTVAGSLALADDTWQSTVREGIDNTLGAVTGGQLQVVEVRQTPMQGVYEVIMNSGEILFSDLNGQYLLAGEMYEARREGLVNLTAETRKLQTARMVADIDPSLLIEFAPEERRATVTVFTDVDCTYCRRLHHDMDLINAAGIAVRYAAYPRGGVSSSAYPKMVSVWCAPNPVRAITQAKNGQNLPTRDCDNPVLEQHAIGNLIGITGTPAIILEDGTLVPGYLDVETLTSLVLGE